MPFGIILASDLEKWSLCHSGWSICLNAVSVWGQHIFDHHSSIFSADVAPDKHCMISSQKFWWGTKLPQGHWLLLFTGTSLLCKFLWSLFFFILLLHSWTCDSLWHGTNYFIIIHFICSVFFFFWRWWWWRGCPDLQERTSHSINAPAMSNRTAVCPSRREDVSK